jgi:O-antigen ligase
MLTAEDKLGGTTSFIFAVDNGNVTLADKFGSAVTEEAESFGFEGVERLGSNRGYIWSRSIPLLAKNIFIGQGTDCFAFAFPQNDVRAKLRFLSNPYVIVDKPHNMYLQTGINTGVISLVITLAVFVLFIWQSFSVVKSKNYLLTAIRLGILGGCVAYMVAGLTTDSVVSVAPVFWVMLGTGFGLGYAEKSTEE